MSKTWLTSLFMAVAMAWVSFASSSLAFTGMQQDMAGISTSHEMAMSSMPMQDCPSHKAGQMSMDTSKCAVACYGLATSVVLDFTSFQAHAPHIAEAPTGLTDQHMVSYVLGVPTPPPNFA